MLKQGGALIGSEGRHARTFNPTLVSSGQAVEEGRRREEEEDGWRSSPQLVP